MTAPNSRPGFHRVYRPGAPKVYRVRDTARDEAGTVPTWRLVLYGVLFALAMWFVMALSGLLA